VVGRFRGKFPLLSGEHIFEEVVDDTLLEFEHIGLGDDILGLCLGVQISRGHDSGQNANDGDGDDELKECITLLPFFSP
jgi:hypothetical protein